MTTEGAGAVRVAAAGDAALVLAFPPRIDPAINERAANTADLLRGRWHAILRDVVVGYCTVTVSFDPLRVDAAWLESEMRAAASAAVDVPARLRDAIEVPVCYDGDLAPDMDVVATFGGLSADEVIARHLARTYRVYMVGFVPGFAYMAEVDPRIAAPRRATPRTAVPAGAVALAGGQTGVYPAATPGGWNIIGRTPLRPYDPARQPLSLFRPGDAVRFVRISRGEYDRAS